MPIMTSTLLSYLIPNKYISKPSLGDRGQSQVESYQKLKKIVLDAALLNTQHYKKVQIKGKVEQTMEKSSTFPYTLV